MVKINKVLNQKVIEPIQTERVTPIVFEPKKKSLYASALIIENSTHYQKETCIKNSRMDECFDSLGEAAAFFFYDAISDYRQDGRRDRWKGLQLDRVTSKHGL